VEKNTNLLMMMVWMNNPSTGEGIMSIITIDREIKEVDTS